MKVILLPLAGLIKHEHSLPLDGISIDLSAIHRSQLTGKSSDLIDSTRPKSLNSLQNTQRQLNRYIYTHERKYPQPKCRLSTDRIHRSTPKRYRSTYDMEVIRKLYSPLRNWFTSIDQAANVSK